jgi:serine/threonine protein phosphatase PrpC
VTETTFTWGMQTDVGRVREVNQDAVHARDGLFVVADGMGGHQGGEVASAVAVDVIADTDETPTTMEALVASVRAAHEAIVEQAESDTSLAGMGTTVCAIARLDNADQRGMLGLVNVGDSRIYRFSAGELDQVSEDHSLVGDLFRAGHLTAEEAAVHPQRNIVTRALGIGHELLVDYWEVPAVAGDQYLLCSDGLVDEIGDSQIAAAMRRLEDPTEVVDELVRLTLEAGARDNVSVLVVRIDASDHEAPADVIDGPTTSTPMLKATALPIDAGDVGYLNARVPLDPDGADDRVDIEPPESRASTFKRRAIGVLILTVLVVIGAIWVIASYARDNYFVGFENQQMVVYQGQPGGVLWFDPTVEEGVGLLRDDLTPALASEVEGNPEFDNLADAQQYVSDLEDRVDEANAGSDEPDG